MTVYIPEIYDIVSSQFINAGDYVEITSLSAVTGIPLLYYGRGGYGKSEMTQLLLKNTINMEHGWGVYNCTPDTSATDLFGGNSAITIKGVNEDITKASLDHWASFVGKTVFFFEEALDPSPTAMAALKEALTSGAVYVDGNRIDSRNKWLLGATNLNPTEYANNLPDEYRNSINAFLQRFLIVKQEWATHSASQYLDLFRFKTSEVKATLDFAKVLQLRQELNIAVSNQTTTGLHWTRDKLRLLAELTSKVAKETNGQHIVSPRSSIWALRLITASALIRGANIVDVQDFAVLKYVDSYSPITADLFDFIEEQKSVVEAKANLEQATESLDEIVGNYKATIKGKKDDDNAKLAAMVVVNKLGQLQTNTHEIAVPNSLYNDRVKLEKKIGEWRELIIKEFFPGLIIAVPQQTED